MEFKSIAAVAIFTLTLFLLLKRPKGLNIGVAAVIGALLSLLFGTVTVFDALGALTEIWDAALAFFGIVTLSVTLDAMGFFKWAALKIIGYAKGDGRRLYIYIALLTASVSILFANDSAILILTPIVVEITRQLDFKAGSRMVYLFAAGFVADTAAMPLITSNPVNIVSADFFHYTFLDHLLFMGPVTVVTVFFSILVVYLFFRSKIPVVYEAKCVNLDCGFMKSSSSMVKIIFATLISVDVGYVLTSFIRLPVSTVICSGAFFLLIVYYFYYKRAVAASNTYKSLPTLLREVNWGILVFMIGIFMVVQGLRVAGIVDFISSIMFFSSTLPSYAGFLTPSLIVTVLASFMNNWPMTLLGLVSIRHAVSAIGLTPGAATNLIFSNIIGNNIGPHFFPIGSLAILMWFDVIRRGGLTVTLREYLRVGSILSIIEVAFSSLILYFEVGLLGLTLPIFT
ncbi:MAG: hypothetical protein OdinLCB4_006000 [Candidatus Odinarchaeum yellowstonii]|uniref:Arsenical pump membrane protein n=1 Tax=Odinarchaeota yellowstonii (strain LCB_4) TaxID=1841599 RepID=A0AAF0D1P0_ODILC|nr:MAG: hypothetical protein OdinLCB4_006000 [Candidatus Odinarchaeum yellowstonii]